MNELLAGTSEPFGIQRGAHTAPLDDCQSVVHHACSNSSNSGYEGRLRAGTTHQATGQTREMVAGASKSSADWRRLCAAVNHVVVWVMSCVVRSVVVLLSTSSLVAGLPVDELPRLYLADGLTGRLTCPFDEDPPNSLVAWSKDGRPLNATSTWRKRDGEDEQPRVRYGRGGTLIFAAASAVDEGVYTCLVYAPLHKGPESSPVRVLVRGKYALSVDQIC